MRKIDYQTLARLVKQIRDDAAVAYTEARDPETEFVCIARGQAVADLARQFADATNVDREAFLRECGIAP